MTEYQLEMSAEGITGTVLVTIDDDGVRFTSEGQPVSVKSLSVSYSSGSAPEVYEYHNAAVDFIRSKTVAFEGYEEGYGETRWVYVDDATYLLFFEKVSASSRRATLELSNAVDYDTQTPRLSGVSWTMPSVGATMHFDNYDGEDVDCITVTGMDPANGSLLPEATLVITEDALNENVYDLCRSWWIPGEDDRGMIRACRIVEETDTQITIEASAEGEAVRITFTADDTDMRIDVGGFVGTCKLLEEPAPPEPVALVAPCPYGLSHYGPNPLVDTVTAKAMIDEAVVPLPNMGNRMTLNEGVLSWEDYPADMSYFRRKFGDAVSAVPAYSSLFPYVFKQPTRIEVSLYDGSDTKYHLRAHSVAAGAPVVDLGGSYIDQNLAISPGGFSDWTIELSNIGLTPLSATSFRISGKFDVASITDGQIQIDDAISFSVDLSDTDWALKSGKGYAHRKNGITVHHADGTEESLEVGVYFESLALRESEH